MLTATRDATKFIEFRKTKQKERTLVDYGMKKTFVFRLECVLKPMPINILIFFSFEKSTFVASLNKENFDYIIQIYIFFYVNR
jgi:hypothetical protein